MELNDVIQFNENHKWCGCFGYIDEVKICGDDVRYMIAVPTPQKGTAFIFVMKSENAIDKIGHTDLVMMKKEDEEN